MHLKILLVYKLNTLVLSCELIICPQPVLPECTMSAGEPENTNVPDRYTSSGGVTDTPVNIEEVVRAINEVN